MKYAVITAAVALSLALPALAQARQADGPKAVPRVISTFSVVAYDPGTGEVGVAVQSKFFAVGSVVPYAKAGVGAVASQAYGNPTYGPLGLELMAAGVEPQDAINACLAGDEHAAERQIGMVSVGGGSGLAGTYTGDECMDWAGGRTGVTSDGLVYSVQGNILTGAEVVDAMATALEGGDIPEVDDLTENEARALGLEDFAGRLLKALIAGEQLGGDSRGMQSAALLVCQAGAGYGGYNDRKYDLRVDDAQDPFDEMARLLNLARPFALINEGYNYAYAGDFDRAFATFEFLIKLDPENLTHHYHYACALALAGDSEAALNHLRTALEFDPDMKQNAREDPDLESLHGLDEFWELVGGREQHADTEASQPSGD